ncbi:MAG: hypothetical protein CBC24_04345 [Candidatus Pelagibacter sp. TMED64]|nr:hypothetical protein [Candidatus Pelagibacter sp.]OUU65892.1 MAG: hypothetical protein CBC24_04345 [Candidatus Pelagibacter sp. TMED64]|tara:strand:- start:3367 stop:4209 length:843 start_codon:yes stop_codon:yes gene_type:complete
MKIFFFVLKKIVPISIKQFLKNLYGELTKNYISKKILGNKDTYLKIFNGIKNQKYPEIDNYIFKNNLLDIDKIFLDNIALLTQISIKKSEPNYQHGRLIYSILYKYILDNKNKFEKFFFLDIGTAKGFSSIIIAKAGIDTKITFKVNSYDVLPHSVPMYWNYINDNKGKITRKDLLKDYTNFTNNISYINKKVSNDEANNKNIRINFAFIDASHIYKDVKNDFNFVNQRQESNDIIIFDDVTKEKFNGVVKLVNEIDDKIYKIEKIMSSKNRGYAIAKKI